MRRTTVVIDEKLMREAIRITGARSHREAIDVALRRLVDKDGLYRALARFHGRHSWKGDIDAGRRARA